MICLFPPPTHSQTCSFPLNFKPTDPFWCFQSQRWLESWPIAPMRMSSPIMRRCFPGLIAWVTKWSFRRCALQRSGCPWPVRGCTMWVSTRNWSLTLPERWRFSRMSGQPLSKLPTQGFHLTNFLGKSLLQTAGLHLFYQSLSFPCLTNLRKRSGSPCTRKSLSAMRPTGDGFEIVVLEGYKWVLNAFIWFIGWFISWQIGSCFRVSVMLSCGLSGNVLCCEVISVMVWRCGTTCCKLWNAAVYSIII